MGIKDIVEKHKIKYLLHFTRIENLKSILDNGIIARRKLETNNLDFVYNDNHRADNYTNAICCSISHPNYKMFYSLRQSNPNQEWVVIEIKEKVIWEKDCAFCTENAASSNVTSIPIENRKGEKAFKELFKEKTLRKELQLPSNYPTNPQAEVLVFEKIEPQNIIGVVFQNQNKVNEYKKLYKEFQFIYETSYFSYRKDYEYWR